MAEDWKTVRLRAPLHERMTMLAESRGESAASCIERTLEAGLARAPIDTPPNIEQLELAITEAESGKPRRALLILRAALDRAKVSA